MELILIYLLLMILVAIRYKVNKSNSRSKVKLAPRKQNQAQIAYIDYQLKELYSSKKEWLGMAKKVGKSADEFGKYLEVNAKIEKLENQRLRLNAS